MEVSHVINMLVVVLSCLLVATVWCEEEQGSQLEDFGSNSQPQKRSLPDLSVDEAAYLDSDANDKRSSLFRFGKRGSLFRFGKRGSLFRFGKRGSLFRFGKRGSLFRFGKRDGSNMGEDEEFVFPGDVYVSDDVKRAVNGFHWGRELSEE